MKKVTVLMSLIGVMAVLVLVGAVSASSVEGTNYRKLTFAETNVIVNGETEAPFSGIYVDTFENGLYTCRRCAVPLYESDSKFRAHCGWPAFDSALENAVEQRPDDDGVRTEILCMACGGHLGHVFTGEGYTETNIRHCVNSISIDFVEAENLEVAYFAGGCFWGVEQIFDHTVGVLEAESGYMGGSVENPEYSSVCSGSTGHAETVRVLFNNSVVSFEELAKTFFEVHDPTQLNYQGPDLGTQYRSAIFYTTESQFSTSLELIEILNDRGLHVVTEVKESTDFWKAESYHQNYFDLHGVGASCHIRVNRFD